MNAKLDAAIQATIVPNARRMQFLPSHFGQYLMMPFEGAVYDHARHLSSEYQGGYWDYFDLSNGGGYMRPHRDCLWLVTCNGNGYRGKLSSDAFGITATMFALSHLAFRYENHQDAARLSDHFHALRDFLRGHPEAGGILAAID